MKIIREQGYQVILFKDKVFDLTPIAPESKLNEIIKACEKAKKSGTISHYIVRHVTAKYEILSDIDLGVI